MLVKGAPVRHIGVSFFPVTEEEIYKGILAVDNADTACYWFKRTLEGLTDNTGDKAARRYMDIANGQPDEEALKLLNKLKLVHIYYYHYGCFFDEYFNVSVVLCVYIKRKERRFNQFKFCVKIQMSLGL